MYDPYGKVSVRHGVRDAAGNDTSESEWDERTSNTFDNEILYCGYRFDTETGLYHVRFRMYHPTLGRWVTRDRIGYVDGMGLYEYAGCGPTNTTDPSGLAAIVYTGLQLEEHETREAVNAATGRTGTPGFGGSRLEPLDAELGIETRPYGECCLIITKVTWGITIHMPTEDLAASRFGPTEEALARYGRNRDKLATLPNVLFYKGHEEANIPSTWQAVWSHELEHAFQLHNAAETGIPFAVKIYSGIYCKPTMEELQKLKLQHEQNDIPEGLIRGCVLREHAIKYEPKHGFERGEGGEFESVTAERDMLEIQWMAETGVSDSAWFSQGELRGQ